MKIQKAENIFPIILSIIGLIAYIMTILVFLEQVILDNDLNDINVWRIGLLYFVLIYGWFTISWYYASRSFYKIEQKSEEQELPSVLTNTTIGVGALLFPISLALSIMLNSVVYFFIHFLFAGLIYLGLRLLIPVVYPDYRKYLLTGDTGLVIENEWISDYLGKWVCEVSYTGHISEEEFEKDDIIVVYDAHNEEKLYYNSISGSSGMIHYSELDTYWKLIERRNKNETESEENQN